MIINRGRGEYWQTGAVKKPVNEVTEMEQNLTGKCKHVSLNRFAKARIVRHSQWLKALQDGKFCLWEKAFAVSQKFLLFANLAYYCAGIRLISHPEFSQARQFF